MASPFSLPFIILGIEYLSLFNQVNYSLLQRSKKGSFWLFVYKVNSSDVMTMARIFRETRSSAFCMCSCKIFLSMSPIKTTSMTPESFPFRVVPNQIGILH